jgi:teichuronic acid biosynthesis glycosyltransferase TuaG
MLVNSISVIIPHYNRPEMVAAALESILKQTIKPDEILLVDDCSTPENRQKLDKLSGLARVITTPKNVGPNGARQFGVDNATGEWIAFLDDDDTWLPNKLERQIQYIEAHPEVVALGGGTMVRTPEGREEYWGEQRTYRIDLAHALCFTASLGPALIIRRDVLLNIGGFDSSLRYMEDYEFGIRLLASGNETHFLGEPLFIYNRGGHQQASVQHVNMLKSEIRVLNLHANLVRSEFGSLGLLRLKARCCKRYGLRMGGAKGRLLWAYGCALLAAFGQRLAGVEE